MPSAVRLSILVATLALAGCQTQPAPYDPYRPPVQRNDPPVYVQPPRDPYRPPVQPNNPYRPGPNDGYQGDGYVRGGTPNQPGSLYAGGGNNGYVRGGEPSLYGNGGGRNDVARNDGGYVDGGGRNDGFGQQPPAPRLGGAWRLMTTGSNNINCSIKLSPGEGGSGSVSAPANCYSYTHLKSYEMRGRDLVLVDAFGGSVHLQPSGGYWQGRGRDGEGVILQR